MDLVPLIEIYKPGKGVAWKMMHLFWVLMYDLLGGNPNNSVQQKIGRVSLLFSIESGSELGEYYHRVILICMPLAICGSHGHAEWNGRLNGVNLEL